MNDEPRDSAPADSTPEEVGPTTPADVPDGDPGGDDSPFEKPDMDFFQGSDDFREGFTFTAED